MMARAYLSLAILLLLPCAFALDLSSIGDYRTITSDSITVQFTIRSNQTGAGVLNISSDSGVLIDNCRRSYADSLTVPNGTKKKVSFTVLAFTPGDHLVFYRVNATGVVVEKVFSVTSLGSELNVTNRTLNISLCGLDRHVKRPERYGANQSQDYVQEKINKTINTPAFNKTPVVPVVIAPVPDPVVQNLTDELAAQGYVVSTERPPLPPASMDDDVRNTFYWFFGIGGFVLFVVVCLLFYWKVLAND